LLNIKIIRSKSILMSHHSACFAARAIFCLIKGTWSKV
jgi:hypothetical protein